MWSNLSLRISEAGRHERSKINPQTWGPRAPTSLGVLEEAPLINAALGRRAQQERHRRNQHQDWDGQAAV